MMKFLIMQFLDSAKHKIPNISRMCNVLILSPLIFSYKGVRTRTSFPGVFLEKGVLKINTHAEVWFELSCKAKFTGETLCQRAVTCNFMKKESLTQVFSCELCKIFKNLSYKTPPVAVSDPRTSYKTFQKTAIWEVKLHPRLIFWGALSPLWVSFYQKDNLISYLVIVTKVFCFTPTFSFKFSLGQAFRFQQAK